MRDDLREMGYDVETVERTYSPITTIWFDIEQGTMWGGASDYGDDYGVAWQVCAGTTELPDSVVSTPIKFDSGINDINVVGDQRFVLAGSSQIVGAVE